MIEGLRYAIGEVGDEGQHEASRRLLHLLVESMGLIDGADEEVAHDPQGRPYLPSYPQLGISISHCTRAVAVAISEKGRVGIDVECRRKVSEALMKRVCNEEELSDTLGSADPTMRFLWHWTRKEAVLKWRGTGIRGFNSLRMAAKERGCRLIEVPCEMADVVASVAMDE